MRILKGFNIKVLWKSKVNFFVSWTRILAVDICYKQRDHRRMQQNCICNEQRVVREPTETFVATGRHFLM
jgi:hypothetical protein